MPDDRFAELFQECAALQNQDRFTEALGLLEAQRGTEAENNPLYWAWVGSLLLDCRRIREAEQTLRSVLVRPRWPMGDVNIASALGEVLLWLRRYDEAIEVVIDHARRGHLSCELIRLRSLLALGMAQEVLRVAKARAVNDQGQPALRLVLLEAILDIRGSSRDLELTEAANRVHIQLQNALKAGLPFNRFELSELARLEARLLGPFGFGRGP